MGRPISPDGPTKSKCSYPGCEVVMHRGYSTFDSGFCRIHGGQQRGRATDKAASQIQPEPSRPGVRLVMAPAQAISLSGEGFRVPVSLPKEPWA